MLRSATRDRVEHELGSAVTVIRGYLRMLADGRVGALSREQATCVHEASKQVDRLCQLMRDLRADDEAPLARRLEPKPIHLASLVRAAVESVRPVLEEGALEVHLDLEVEVPPLSLDPARFEQVVINLLFNAAKFAPKGSEVGVRLDVDESEDGPRVHLSLTDEGPGIPAEEIEQVFLPYVRGRRADAVEGRGLGLAICKEIVEAHGGTIEAIPVHRGAHLRVTLKLQEGQTRV